MRRTLAELSHLLIHLGLGLSTLRAPRGASWFLSDMGAVSVVGCRDAVMGCWGLASTYSFQVISDKETPQKKFVFALQQ